MQVLVEVLWFVESFSFEKINKPKLSCLPLYIVKSMKLTVKGDCSCVKLTLV